jgi:hypothetical protein
MDDQQLDGAPDAQLIPAEQAHPPRAVQRRPLLSRPSGTTAHQAIPLRERPLAVRERLARLMLAQMLIPTTPIAVRDERERDLIELGDATLDPLREALAGEERFYMRLRMVRIAGCIGGPQALELLRQVWAEDPHDSVRRMAWTELGRLGVDIPPPAGVGKEPAIAAPIADTGSSLADDRQVARADRSADLAAVSALPGPASFEVSPAQEAGEMPAASLPEESAAVVAAAILADNQAAGAQGQEQAAAHLPSEDDLPIWERDTLPIPAVLVKQLATNPRLAAVAAEMIQEAIEATTNGAPAAGPLPDPSGATGAAMQVAPRLSLFRWLFNLLRFRRRRVATSAPQQDASSAPLTEVSMVSKN